MLFHLCLAAVMALSLAVLPDTAGAHSDTGEATIEEIERTSDGRVRLAVGVVYEGDGHLAEEAEVTATFSRPGSEPVGPVDLVAGGPGIALYTTEVDLPAGGGWTVAVDVSNPTAQAEAPVPDTASGGGDTGGSGGADGDGSDATGGEQDEPGGEDGGDVDAPATTAVDGEAADEADETSDGGQEVAPQEEAGAVADDDESDESSPIVLGALALLVVLVVGVLLWRRQERRRRGGEEAQDAAAIPAERSAASSAAAKRSTDPEQSSSSDGPSSTT